MLFVVFLTVSSNAHSSGDLWFPV